MKKVLALLTMLALTFALTSCGKFTCDACGSEKSGKKHTFELLGEKAEICNDCYNGLKELGSGLGF